jgi:2-methylcitrate dehydratase PrpD
MSNHETLSLEIGAWAQSVSIDDVPKQVQDQALLNILDAVGIAFASTHYEFATRSIAATVALGSGPRGAIACTERFNVRDQAMLNGILIHGLDFDDTHVPGVIHATASALPTAIAIADDRELSGNDLVLGFLIALEIGARVGTAANGGFHAQGFHPTGLAGAFGAATGAAKMIGLDAHGIASAQGIVGSLASGAMEFLETGAWTKRLHPGWAAVTGITAAELAKAKFEAPLAIYEGRFGLYASHTPAGHDLKMDAVTAELGTAWELLRVAIKPYAACHFTHACIDIAIELVTENNLTAADIESVTTIVPSQVVPVVCEPALAKLTPRSDYDAKFSLPFIVATAIAKRRFTLADLTDDCLVDAELLELAAKVSYQNDPNPTFPKYFHGEVIIQTKDGRTLRKREDINRGADERPLAASEVETKFRDNVSLVAGSDVSDRVLNAVMSLPTTKNSRDFVEALRSK